MAKHKMKDVLFGYIPRALPKDYYFSPGNHLLSTYYMLDTIPKPAFINMNKHGLFSELTLY